MARGHHAAPGARAGEAGRQPGQRQLRVGEELRHALAQIVERGELRDPELDGRSITITEVRVSPDLRNATVFVTPLGGGKTAPILSGLRRARPFLRHELSRMVLLRQVPDLSFVADSSYDEAERIESLLRTPDVRRDLSGEEEASETGTRDGVEDPDDGA